MESLVEFLLVNQISEGYNTEELLDYLSVTSFVLEKVENQNNEAELKLFYFFEEEKKEVGKILVTEILRSSSNNTFENMVKCIIVISDVCYINKMNVIQSAFSIDFEKLKVCLKEYFTKKGKLDYREKYFKKCLWLKDEQSCLISAELSKKIYRLENKLRSVIEEIFCTKIGYNWANDHAKVYTTGRDVGDYKQKVKYFKDIDMMMNNLLTNEVIELIMDSNITLSDNTKNIIMVEKELNKLLPEIFDINGKTSDSKLRKALQSSSLFDKESHSLFDKYINEYSQSGNRNLKNQWDEITKRRNHIAHNKPLDIHFYEESIIVFNKVTDILDQIINKFREEIIREKVILVPKFEESWKSKSSYEKIKEIVDEENEKAMDHEEHIAELESGVSVATEEEIIEIFEEYMNEKIDELFEILNNSNFDIIKNNNFDDKVVLLKGEYRLNRKLYIEISSDIILVDGSQGGTSEVEITIKLNGLENNKEYKERISFINSEYEFNNEQGNYMPIIESELQIIDFENRTDEIVSEIENEFPDFQEIANQKYSSYEYVKDGAPSLLVSEECPYCGEWDTVCIDPEYFDILDKPYSETSGLCLSCGEICEAEENAQGYIKLGEVGDDLWTVDLFESD